MHRTPPHEFTVPDALAGERLDRAIAALAPHISRGEARRLIAAGVVFVGGKRTGIQSRLVRAGERITWQEPARVHDARAGGEPRIVVERPELWIIDKPAGMPVEATRSGSHGTLHEWLTRTHGPAFITHRLDTATSGLIVVARDAHAQAALNRAFAAHVVLRRYLAVVTPAPPWQEQTLDAPLDGRAAVTHAAVAARAPGGGAAALLVRLATGRSRQIRRHLAAAGFPVAGERPDGSRAGGRLLLHAFELGLPALDAGGPDAEPRLASAAPPDDFRAAAQALGLESADLEAAITAAPAAEAGPIRP